MKKSLLIVVMLAIVAGIASAADARQDEPPQAPRMLSEVSRPAR
jgi:opacity protein-like surface antigen